MTDKRLVEAEFVVCAAENEFSEEDAAKVRWLISHIPSVDAEIVRHGRWSGFKAVGVDDDDCYVYRQFCSICNGQSPWDYNYCPNCGAKMDGELDENN